MRAAVTAFLLLLSPLVFAAETITVHYVEVPVSVVGHDGNPVRGLTKANFQLFDEKRRVDIASFDAIDFSSPQSLAANRTNPAVHRAFLLLFDLGYSSPAALDRAKSAARTFVSKSILPTDVAAVATVEPTRGYRLVTNFTTDRNAVLAAIDQPLTYRGADPLQIAGTAALDKRDVDRDAAQAQTAKDAQYFAVLQDEARAMRTNDDQYLHQQLHRELDWIGQLAASLRNLRGRTQIIYLSAGFSAGLVQGRSANERNEEYEDADMMMRGQWYEVDPERRFGSNASLTALDALQQALKGSGITLHAIDIEGVRIQSDLAHGQADNSDEALFLLARPTGGEVFRNSNDLAGNFARMLHRQEMVYVLGFQAPVSSPGKLHQLAVKVAGVERGATVLYRQGYFEGGTRSTAFEETVSAADIVMRDLPQNDVSVAALAVAFPANGATAQVPVVIDIGGNDLLKSVRGNSVEAEIFLYAFDEQGAVRDRAYQRITLDTAKTGDLLRQNGVKYVATLALPPGKYAIKTLVRMPATDQKGFARTDVVVPAGGQTALLTPFVLDDPRAWVMVKGPEHGGGGYPFHVNGEPFVPSASGRVPAGAVRKVAVFVENAQPEEMTWQTSPAATLLAQMKSAAGTKLVLQIDPAVSADRFDVTVRKSGVAFTASARMTSH